MLTAEIIKRLEKLGFRKMYNQKFGLGFHIWRFVNCDNHIDILPDGIKHVYRSKNKVLSMIEDTEKTSGKIRSVLAELSKLGL